MKNRQQEEIQHYLATGEVDVFHSAWRGETFERSLQTTRALLDALLAEVNYRAGRKRHIQLPDALDLERLTRAKVEPMVHGLFPKAEQEAVLAVLERSIVFVTHDSLEAVLRGCSFLHTAWDVANLYLTSLGAGLLSDKAPRIGGLTVETTCFVSPEYFNPKSDRFADFILHETAHIFHNCKRGAAGLPRRGKREWLLDIDFQMRETFAHACEAYGRILELGPHPRDRRQLLSELLSRPMPADDRVHGGEYRAALAEAVSARNGWKRILRRCAVRRSPRSSGR